MRTAVGLGVGAVLLAGCSDGYVAPPPPAATSSSPAAAEAAAVETVAGLQAALASADAATAAELGGDEATADQLAAAAENVRRLGLDRTSLRFLTRESGGASGEWSADTELTWRYRGLDRTAARREITVRFSPDGTAITGLGTSDRAGALPTWLQGPLEVSRAGTTGLAAVAPASDLDADEVAARVAEGLARVGAVLGGRPTAVVEVPADSAALDRALDAPQGTYAAAAAVTAPVDGALTADAPVHVFVNPAVYRGLDEVAGQVVMTHELVHAVTRAPVVTGVPLWFIEGFADYVALRDVDLPVQRTAGQIIERVSADRAPRALPSDAEMNLTAAHLGAQYEASWLACVVIAEQAGEQALVGLYRDVMGGADLTRALPRRTGWTVDELTDAWRTRLTSLADRG